MALELKEGIVLDRDGTPLTGPSRPSSKTPFHRIRVFQVHPIAATLLLPVFLVLGLSALAIVLALGFVFFVVRAILRATGVVR